MTTICNKTEDQLAANLFTVAMGQSASEAEYTRMFLWDRLGDDEKRAATMDIHQLGKIDWNGRVRVMVMVDGASFEVSRRNYTSYIEPRIYNDEMVWHDGQGGIIHGERPALKKLSPEAAQGWVDAAQERIEAGQRARSPISGQFKRQR